MRQVINSLPEDLRQIVIMKEFEEMTFQEISETLELPLSTVKSRLYTALKQMRMKLERTPSGDCVEMRNDSPLNFNCEFAPEIVEFLYGEIGDEREKVFNNHL